MKPFRKAPVRYSVEAIGIVLIYALFRLMPLAWGTRLGSWLASVVGPRLRAHRIILDNLHRVFPHKTPAEIKALARACWQNLGCIPAEYAHIGTLADRCTIVGQDVLDQIKASGKAVIFVSSHLANYEPITLIPMRQGLQLMQTFRPFNNPIVNRFSRWIQGQVSPILVGKSLAGTRQMMQGLGRGISLMIMCDQRLREGIRVNFLGHPAWTADGPARLALRHNTPLVPVQVIRHGLESRFTVIFHPSIQPQDFLQAPDSIHALTQHISDMIGDWVLQNPEQWFWPHKRWDSKERHT